MIRSRAFALVIGSAWLIMSLVGCGAQKSAPHVASSTTRAASPAEIRDRVRQGVVDFANAISVNPVIDDEEGVKQSCSSGIFGEGTVFEWSYTVSFQLASRSEVTRVLDVATRYFRDHGGLTSKELRPSGLWHLVNGDPDKVDERVGFYVNERFLHGDITGSTGCLDDK